MLDCCCCSCLLYLCALVHNIASIPIIKLTALLCPLFLLKSVESGFWRKKYTHTQLYEKIYSHGIDDDKGDESTKKRRRKAEKLSYWLYVLLCAAHTASYSSKLLLFFLSPYVDFLLLSLLSFFYLRPALLALTHTHIWFLYLYTH